MSASPDDRYAVFARCRHELQSARELLEKVATELDLLGRTIPEHDPVRLRVHAALMQSQAALAGWVALGTRAVSERLALLAELPAEGVGGAEVPAGGKGDG